MRIQRNKDKISHEDIQPSNNTMTHFNDMYKFAMKLPQNNKMIISGFEHVVMVFLPGCFKKLTT